MLTIESEPPAVGEPCECCGGRTTSLTRFVEWNGDAYAVYYAQFSDNHPDGHVSALISIWDWGEDSSPAERRSFYVRIRLHEENLQISAFDARCSPWEQVDIMGRTLDREEALAHPRIKDVFHIPDHIEAENQPIIDYFNRRA